MLPHGKLKLFSLLWIASLTLSACAGQGGSGPKMLTQVGKGEGEVAIVAWPGYIERGKNDANYDWVTQFERQSAAR